MKTLHLTLEKELLIVELPLDPIYYNEILLTDAVKVADGKGARLTLCLRLDNGSEFHTIMGLHGKWKLFCKATDLTEEIAAGLVEKVMNGHHFQNYNSKEIIDRWCKSAIDSFRSAIEANGFHWGVNPYQLDLDELCEWGFVAIDGKTCSKSDRYEKAKDKTFNLKQTLIFER